MLKPCAAMPMSTISSVVLSDFPSHPGAINAVTVNSWFTPRRPRVEEWLSCGKGR